METELRTARYNFQYFRCRLYHPRIYDAVKAKATNTQMKLQVRKVAKLGQVRAIIIIIYIIIILLIIYLIYFFSSATTTNNNYNQI